MALLALYPLHNLVNVRALYIVWQSLGYFDLHIEWNIQVVKKAFEVCGIS